MNTGDPFEDLAPQMAIYSRLALKYHWMPLLMHLHQPRFSSAVVNTDSAGFRVNNMGGQSVLFSEHMEGSRPISAPFNCLLGGSTVFGVGSTADSRTVSAFLSEGTGETYLNLGARAFTSTQEVILLLGLLPHLHLCKKLVVLSGINSLACFRTASYYSLEFGSLFMDGMFRRGMSYATRGVLKTILGAGIQPGYGNTMYRRIRSFDDEKELLLRNIERDIEVLAAMARVRGMTIMYILQPHAEWIQRELAEEEKRLFSHLDGLAKNHWRRSADFLTRQRYDWYRIALSRCCENAGVTFVDMNAQLEKEQTDGQWLFVDRVHLTDLGARAVANVIGKLL